MKNGLFDIERFQELLRQHGFAPEDSQTNYQQYLEQFLAQLLTFFLDQLNAEQKKTILGENKLNTDEGCLAIINNFNQAIANKSVTITQPNPEQLNSFFSNLKKNE